MARMLRSSSARALVAAAAGLALAAPARAQVPAEQLRVGDRVRIEIGPNGPQRTGRFLALDQDSLVVHLDGRAGPIVHVPWSLVSRAWVSAGRSRNPLRAMGIGLALGFVTGIALGAVAEGDSGGGCTPPDTPICPNLSGIAVFGGAVLGSAAGLVVGGVIGLATTHDKWERLKLPARVVAIPAGRGRPGVAIRLRL